jgi:hypothetical protein
MPTLSGRTVLVVDDEPVILEVTRRILERAGYAVITALSGLEALQLCQTARPRIDILLTDIRMPGMDGADLARGITALQPTVLVLFMTAQAPESALRVIRAWQPYFASRRIIQKPFRIPDLVGRIQELLHTNESGDNAER